MECAAPRRLRWERPAFWALLLGTALLYLWDLGASGWANSFYAAAAQAGSASWKAFFFGSLDAANSITVDKTPLALWPMALSVRLFGLSSWSILVPQALEGLAAVALVHRVVRRSTGSAAAGLAAGLVVALTPVAVLMFRFDNPDAMLVLLLTAAAAATLRGVRESDRGRPARWLALAGVLVGLAFLAKMLQAFLVLPAFALVWLVFARTTWPRRLRHLLGAFVAMLVAGGWWVVIVSLWPAASRPYIGGSQHNSILELTLGYNGLGRLTGNETGSVGGGMGWGSTGLLRLLSSDIGGQVAWLLPAALVLGVAGLVLSASRAVRAMLVLWLGWLVVTAATFSFMAGIFHAYYTVALAPAIGALVGTGGWVLWQQRDRLAARTVLGVAGAGTGVLAFVLLDRSAGYLPWLRWAVLVVALVVGAALLGVHLTTRRVAVAVLFAALASVLAGPAAYSLTTATTAHTGSIPSAGPTVTTGGRGGPGDIPAGMTAGVGRAFAGVANGQPPTGQPPTGQPPTGQPSTGQPPMGQAATGQPGTPPTGLGGPAGTTTGTGSTQRAMQPGGTGGLLDASIPSARVQVLLEQNSAKYTWAAAVVGSNSASGYQLATGLPVMAIGGFNGSDPSPTLTLYKADVAAGKIHWFIASRDAGRAGPGGMGPGGATSSAISSWVAQHFTSRTVDGITMYDLSGSAR